MTNERTRKDMTETTTPPPHRPERVPLPDGTWYDGSRTRGRWTEQTTFDKNGVRVGFYSRSPHSCTSLVLTARGNWVLVARTRGGDGRVNETRQRVQPDAARQWFLANGLTMPAELRPDAADPADPVFASVPTPTPTPTPMEVPA